MKSAGIKHAQKRIARLALVFVACCAAGCGCAEPRNITTSKFPKAEESRSVAAANQLVVYLDTSASMAGYVSDDRQSTTTFSRTLQELRNFVTLINPPVDVLVRRVDARVSEPLSNMLLSQASLDNKVFNGSDTDLAGAVDSFERPISNNLPARFDVLVTDGVQSTNQVRSDLACTSGSDQICVRRKIFELLNKGWGACVIGVRSEFHGNIYSEVSRAQGKPSVLRFDSESKDPQTFRPFYLYVFSPDRAALEPMVASLVDRLKPLVGDDEASLRVLPLTFQYASAGTQAEATVPKAPSAFVTVRKRPASSLPEFTVAIDPETAQKGPQRFSLTLTMPWSRNVLRGVTVQELAGMISWELIPIYPKTPVSGTRYPELKIVGQSVDAAGHLVVDVTAQWPPSVGDLCWRGYRLEGRLAPDQMTPQWVRDWSTDVDTTIERANRTLYLESALLGLWRNDVLKNQLVGEACLIAGER
jgi:hypothetical protein